MVAAEVLVGFIHVVFGFCLLSTLHVPPHTGPDIYSVYTVTFSLLTVAFAAGIWLQKSGGWVGTAAVAAFVIVADALTLLDLPSVPGIPKLAGYGEFTYSFLVLAYLMQTHVRTKYGVTSPSQDAQNEKRRLRKGQS